MEPHKKYADVSVAWPDGKGGAKVEPFMTGFVENNSYLGRPVDFLVMKDGSLLVSDDHAGAIYRISYGGSDGVTGLARSARPPRWRPRGWWPSPALAQQKPAAQRSSRQRSSRRRRRSTTRSSSRTLCAACHGANGRSDMPGMPVLAGQPSFYAITQLFLFREGRRSNEAMTAIAKPMTDDDLRGFSDFIGTLPPVPAPAPATPPDAARMSKGTGARAAAQVRVLPRRRSRRRPAGAAHRRPEGRLPAHGAARLQAGSGPGTRWR